MLAVKSSKKAALRALVGGGDENKGRRQPIEMG
jgi:hypothetical protein